MRFAYPAYTVRLNRRPDKRSVSGGGIEFDGSVQAQSLRPRSDRATHINGAARACRMRC
jgi:hypothetical protein